MSSLKVRMELKYPQQESNWWRKSLKKLIKDPKNVHKTGDNIKINIPDPNLFYAIKDYIEDKSGIVDIQLNSKVLSVSQRDFVVLLAAFADEAELEKICDEINKALRDEGNENFVNDPKSINQIGEAVGMIVDIASIIATVISCIH